MVIFLGRLDEIDKLVKEMDLDKRDFAVLTSDVEKNALGNENPDNARVLFTTQQMLTSRCDGRSFKDATEFHYDGRPRVVRIWDETMLPAQAITIPQHALAETAGRVMKEHHGLGTVLNQCALDMNEVDDGGLFTFPDFIREYAIETGQIDHLLHDAHAEHRKTAKDLWYLSGQSVRIRRDRGDMGSTLLDYHESLPEDLTPLAVLDASGRTKGTYQMWLKGLRDNLVFLRPAPKSYANLTVHLWNTGGGKGVFRSSKRQTLIEGIAKTIHTKPDQEWLVCHHKQEAGFNVERELKALLADHMDLGNIHFLSYGNHMATNEYAHVSNVILAGILYYRPSDYESLTRLSYGMGSEEDIDQDDVNTVKVGEATHLVLQAACRGSVRFCQIDGTCKPCDIYIIAANGTGLHRAIPDLFPDCTMTDWRPVTRTLTGRTKEVYDYVLNSIASGYISFAQVRDAIGVAPSYLKQQIRDNEDFQEMLAQAHIVEGGTPNSRKYPDPHEAPVKYGFWLLN
jgi:hypothetical protein